MDTITRLEEKIWRTIKALLEKVIDDHHQQLVVRQRGRA
jgi:hypothetical protein